MSKEIEPSEKLKKEMYEFYTKIFDSSFDHQKKKNLLTSIAGWEPWSWRVVGITANAVGEIVEEKGHARVKPKLVRDHFFQSRSTTSNNLLSKKHNFDSYWDEFWKNDRTILMTREEHNSINKIEKSWIKDNPSTAIFDIPWQQGLFKSEKVAGFHFSYKKEGEYIYNLFKDRIIKKVDYSKTNAGETKYFYQKKQNF